MNFNIYLDDQTGQRLLAAAEHSEQSRNALIRKAVSEWLARNGDAQWPEAVLSFNGAANMPPFESARDTLKPPPSDPLA